MTRRSASLALALLIGMAGACSDDDTPPPVDTGVKDGPQDGAQKDGVQLQDGKPDGTKEQDGKPHDGPQQKDGSSCGNCQGFTCCGTECRNLNNDPANCGKCGEVCPASKPFCNNGVCDTPPCEGGTTCIGIKFCCGVHCCDLDQVSCAVPGPVAVTVGCHDNACPKGCVQCACAAPDTPIATPAGDRPISSLRAGDLVYSVDGPSVRAVPILAASKNRVSDHSMVRVTLSRGRTLEISAGHPTADGRTFGGLRAGDKLDGDEILSVSVVSYRHPYTYDILPASDTGTYFAAGALIGSTMHDGSL